jgi:uroporphyrinogen decarboxylase
MSPINPIRPKWKGYMTDRERFFNQMHYHSFDRCFNMEFGYWNENFNSWDLFIKNGIIDNDQAEAFFSFDRFDRRVDRLDKRVSDTFHRNVWSTPPNEYRSINVWMSPPFEQKVIGQTDRTQIVVNEDGLIAEVPLDGHDTIPHFIKSSIINPDDWKRIKEERFRRDDPSRFIDVENIKKVHPSNRDYPLGVWTGSMIGKIRDMLTFEGLAYACYDYPDMVEDMVETCCLLVEDALDQLLFKIDFDFAAGWEDICFKNGPIISPDFFKSVVVPRYKRIGAKLKKAGIDIWYTDCDGDVRPILPYLIESGINCLFPFEVNAMGHPAELLNQYGKDLRIMGAVDKMKLSEGKEVIKSYLQSLVPLVERGGFIPFCDHFCPPNVDYQDYLYYLALKEQMFGMK